jgi:hypothetical protein
MARPKTYLPRINTELVEKRALAIASNQINILLALPREEEFDKSRTEKLIALLKYFRDLNREKRKETEAVSEELLEKASFPGEKP